MSRSQGYAKGHSMADSPGIEPQSSEIAPHSEAAQSSRAPQHSEASQPSDRDGNSGSRRNVRRLLGIALFILSFVFYGCLALIPFAAIPTGSKLALSSALIVCGEASFWISVLILGKEAVSRFRSRDQIKMLIDGLRKRFGLCRDPNSPKNIDSMHEER